MILWGPPGCGKTTLALLLAKYCDAEFRAISAVLSGLPEVRQVLAEAGPSLRGRPPHGAVRRRGASLQQGAAGCVPAAYRARHDPVRRRDDGESVVRIELGVAVALPRACDGCGVGRTTSSPRCSRRWTTRSGVSAAADWRSPTPRCAKSPAPPTATSAAALTLLEIAAELAEGEGGAINEATLAQVLADRTRRFDKGGEQFYDQISALHKSMRSSNPDAALYWLRAHARWRRRSELPCAAPDAHGGRGRRPGRSARIADGDRCMGNLRSPGQPRRRSRAGAARDLSGQHREVATPRTWRSTRPGATCASTARRKCRCTSATRRPS